MGMGLCPTHASRAREPRYNIPYPATNTIVLWLIHFLSTKNDYVIPRFIKRNRPLRFLYAISTSNLMYQLKTYITQLKPIMPYKNIYNNFSSIGGVF